MGTTYAIDSYILLHSIDWKCMLTLLTTQGRCWWKVPWSTAYQGMWTITIMSLFDCNCVQSTISSCQLMCSLFASLSLLWGSWTCMHGDYNQFMYHVINFNTLCISPSSLFNFFYEQCRVLKYCLKITAFSTFVQMYANKYHICWLQSWSIRFPLSLKRISWSAYSMLFSITLSHLHCHQYHCVLQ